MRRKAAWVGLFALLLTGLATAQVTSPDNRYPQDSRYPQNGAYGAPSANVIPEGTRFLVVLQDRLETRKIQPGKRFTAKLGEDLAAPNGATIPRGKKVKGHVSSVEGGFSHRLLLSFDQIETQHGWVPLLATVTGVPGEHGVKEETGPEGEISNRGVDKRRAAEAAVIGAGAGAVTGGAAGGSKGAIIGAAAGTGVGLGAGVLTGRNLRLDKGTQLELRLDRQLMVPGAE